MWILGSPSLEFGFFFLPGLISVAISILFPDLGETSLIYALIAMAFIDSGHVYTTVWRTYFHPEERSSHHTYWTLPILFLVVFASWAYFRVPYLFQFVVYATIYHHVRQVYGFSKWYQHLNGRSDKVSDRFLYALAVIPFLTYHFRHGAVASYYSSQDLFLYPHEGIRDILAMIYVAVLIAWVCRESFLWRRGTREINRLLSVAYPAGIYGYCFLIGNTLSQVLFPLLFIHGVAYFGVMGQTLVRTQKTRFKNVMVASLVVIGTAVILGAAESWMEEEFPLASLEQPSLMMALLQGLLLTPLFCHYAFDAWIWKKNHREAKLVFQSS